MTKTFDINPGTTVWFMYKNKPTNGIVKRVWSNTFVSYGDFETIEESEWYYIMIDNVEKSFRKSELFPSKEELKKTL
jgi:hypothetical protein